MAEVSAKLKGDVNTFVDQVEKGIGEIAQQLKVNKAIVYNNTGKPVNFYVYNYTDTVYWVSAMHALAAPGKAASIAASGVQFKVHPDDNKDHEFIVEPHKAYIFNGPGDVDEVRRK